MVVYAVAWSTMVLAGQPLPVEPTPDEAAQLALPDDSYARAVDLFIKEVRANGLESAFAVTLNFLADRLERALPRLPSDGNGTSQPLLLL